MPSERSPLMRALYQDFTAARRSDGTIRVDHPPKIGTVCAFTLALLADLDPNKVTTDSDGRMVLHVLSRSPADLRRVTPTALTFQPLRFEPVTTGGPPRLLLCERVR